MGIDRLGHLQGLQIGEALAAGGGVAFTCQHHASYADPPREITLGAVYAEGKGVVTDKPAELERLLGKRDDPDAIAKALGVRALDLQAPLPLTPVRIPKPWGEELWYTGIEKRGVSLAGGMPIAWLLDVFAPLLAPSQSEFPPLLLKILAPHPVPNLGDLYFELHERKLEVYVVTGIDPDAWPEGKGAVRYGFSAEQRKAAGSDKAFLRAYLEAVRRYEAVRRQLDELLDKQLQAAGLDGGAPLPPDDYQALLGRTPAALRADEEAARKEMHGFTQLYPLSLGDVVRIQPGVPHALQHGVRVVEFQTAHYERQILSFGQKVLTQEGWDTEAALRRVVLDPKPPVARFPAEETTIHDVARFPELEVQRLNLGPGQRAQFPWFQYTLIMGIAGQVRVARKQYPLRLDKRMEYLLLGEALVGAEEAVYVPEGRGTIVMEYAGGEAAVFLVARRPLLA